jgi:hypothetical protein
MSDEIIELRKIAKILTLANAQALETELSKYATTLERKRAWVLIDGAKMPPEIGKASGMRLRTIQDFLKTLVDAGLVSNPRGVPPKKLLDFVPASWVELVEHQNGETDE